MIPKTPDSAFEAEALLGSLKELLRDRRIGYQAIAEAMEVSLPTVKRMLNRPNLPVDRLFEICRIAQIDPMEVFSVAARKRPQHTIFNEEQDLLFYERPEFLSYFQRLIEDGLSPDDIAEAENLTPLSTQRYLSRLAKVGLIERDAGTKIRNLIQPPIGFGPESKVLQSQQAEFMEQVVTQVLSPDRIKGVFALMKPLRLADTLYAEMISEFRAIVDKYAYLSEHPGNRDLPERKDWNLALASGPALIIPRAQIPNL